MTTPQIVEAGGSPALCRNGKLGALSMSAYQVSPIFSLCLLPSGSLTSIGSLDFQLPLLDALLSACAEGETVPTQLEQSNHATTTTCECGPVVNPAWAVGEVFEPLTSLLSFEKQANKKPSHQPIQPLENYLQRFRPDLADPAVKPASLAEIEAILTPDYDHLVREMLKVELMTEFSYWLNVSNTETQGSGYQDSLDLMLSNFAQVIHQQGLGLTRPLTEQLVFSRLQTAIKQQVLANPTNHQTAWLVTSPPDTTYQGYHGSDSAHHHTKPETHHSFFFLYQLGQIESAPTKNGQPQPCRLELRVTQLRAWPNLNQILQLHHQLGAGFEPDASIQLASQLFANVIQLEFPSNLSPADQVAWLQNQIYQDSNTWGRQPDQVPKLDEVRFWQEFRPFFDRVFLKPVAQLFINQNLDPTQVLEMVEIHEQQLLAAVDLRIAELNTNPTFTKFKRLQLLKTVLKNPFKLPQVVKQLRYLRQEHFQPLSSSQRSNDIQKLTSLTIKDRVLGQQLSQSESAWVQASASHLLSLGNFAFGSAQCYSIGSLTLPAQTLLSSAGRVGGPGLPSLEPVGTPEQKLSAKKQLLEQLKNTNYVELDLRSQGATHVWMVPRSYLNSPPGCRVGPEGQVFGPCIVEPDYPNGIPLGEHPEGLELAMNQDQFNQLVHQLELELLASQTLTAIDDDLSLTQQQKLTTKHQVNQLLHQILKTSVGLAEVLGGDSLFDQEELAKLPPKIRAFVQRVLAKVSVLSALDQELSQNTTLLSLMPSSFANHTGDPDAEQAGLLLFQAAPSTQAHQIAA